MNECGTHLPVSCQLWCTSGNGRMDSVCVAFYRCDIGARPHMCTPFCSVRCVWRNLCMIRTWANRNDSQTLCRRTPDTIPQRNTSDRFGRRCWRRYLNRRQLVVTTTAHMCPDCVAMHCRSCNLMLETYIDNRNCLWNNCCIVVVGVVVAIDADAVDC